ncbi:Uncharacterised protein [Bacillus tequilensis]|nr:Uncharacterised protein [Bacillus tequilensis]
MDTSKTKAIRLSKTIFRTFHIMLPSRDTERCTYEHGALKNLPAHRKDRLIIVLTVCRTYL